MKKASITVEAALVLPVFMFTVLGLLLMFSVLSLQTTIQEALMDTAETSSLRAYFKEDKRSGLTAQLEFRNKYPEDALGNNCVYKGLISLANSCEEGNDIILKANYGIKFKLPLWSAKTALEEQQIRIRKFTGRDRRDEGEQNQKRNNETDYVFIAETGTVYHKSRECSHLKLSIRTITNKEIVNCRNEYGEKYKSCEICFKYKKIEEYDILYITKEGNRFHCIKDCSGLKRTVIEVPFEQVKDWKACSRCAG